MQWTLATISVTNSEIIIQTLKTDCDSTIILCRLNTFSNCRESRLDIIVQTLHIVIFHDKEFTGLRLDKM
jgi:hypothetical protein